MAPGELDRDGDRLIGLAGDDAALTGLAACAFAVGGRRAGAGLVLGAALGAVGRTLLSRLLARLGAGGGALLGVLLRASLCGLTGALQAAAGLPVEASIRRGVLGFAGSSSEPSESASPAGASSSFGASSSAAVSSAGTSSAGASSAWGSSGWGSSAWASRPILLGLGLFLLFLSSFSSAIRPSVFFQIDSPLLGQCSATSDVLRTPVIREVFSSSPVACRGAARTVLPCLANARATRRP